MSNYTKSTNFATKDTLPSGNPLKIVRGTEIDTEFNNIATAVNSKADILVGALPVANGGTGAATLTANNVLIGNGTSAVGFVAPSTAGNVLTSNGTTWASTALPTPAASPIPAGTAMLFAQTAAPTGWTKSTTHDNKALRVVNGTASSGGTVAFTTAFVSQAVNGTVGNTTLTTAQIPAHTHTVRIDTDGAGIGPGALNGVGGDTDEVTSSTGGGGSHTHSFTGTAINLAVQYVDVIIATKD
jgi:hypothetical protein